MDGPDADTDAVCDIGAFEFGGVGPFSPEEALVPGIGVLFNDTDADRDPLMAVLVSDVSHSTLTLHDQGAFTYVHSGGENTADSFTYKATDGAAESGMVTVIFTVTMPVNDGPTAVDDSATVDEGATVTVLDSGQSSVLANDSDPESNTLILNTTPVSGPSHGTAVLSGDGTFSYTHDGGSSTGDDFLYTICDQGSPNLCTTATVTITVIEACIFPTAIVKTAWNLIGWACDDPGNPGDIAASLGVSSTNGRVRLLAWDADSQSFTQSFRSDRPFNSLTQLTKFVGYWLFFQAPTGSGLPQEAIQITGTAGAAPVCTFPTTIVKAGWNVIGWACPDPGVPQDIASQLGVTSTAGLVRFLGWDADSQSFTRSFRSDRPFNSLVQLTQWVGYWLFYQPP